MNTNNKDSFKVYGQSFYANSSQSLYASCQLSELLSIEKRQGHFKSHPLFTGKELPVQYKKGLSLWKELHIYLEVKS